MAGALKDGETKTFQVGETDEIGPARRCVIRCAQELGFAEVVTEELAIIATELATNLVKHKTLGGEISIRGFKEGGKEGIEIISSDRGPGITNLKAALKDGYSTTDSMGCGLGAVRRMSDEFDIFSIVANDEEKRCCKSLSLAGTNVISRRWLSEPTETRFAYSCRTHPRFAWEPNGDGFFVLQSQKKLLVGVSDGLGHGAKGNDATVRVLQTLDDFQEDSIDVIFNQLHRALQATRGAAVSLVKLDLESREISHASIGNVTTRHLGANPQTLYSTPGVCGVAPFRTPRVNQLEWTAGDSVWMFSDGLLSKWHPDDYPEFLACHPALVTYVLMTRMTRENDDATVIVVRE